MNMVLNQISVPWLDLAEMLPLLWVIGLGFLVLLIDMLLTDREHKWMLGWIATGGLMVGLILNHVRFPTEPDVLFHGAYVVDAFTYTGNVIILIAALLSILISMDFLWQNDLLQGEYHGLLLLAVAGMMMMAGAGDLLLFLFGFEIMSFVAYILVAWDRDNALSGEAGFKYIITGAFTTAILAYGMVLVYGAAGSLVLTDIGNYLAGSGANDPLIWTGIALIVGSFAYKIAAVPFHLWAPDAYRGAPTPVTGFVATAVKVGAFLGFLRLFLEIIPALSTGTGPVEGTENLTSALAILAGLTVIVANVAAIAYRNLKQMLAYSSIAHAGYVLIGLTALLGAEAAGAREQAGRAILYYLTIYTFMNLGAFACVLYANDDGEERLRLESYAGLVKQHPVLACVFALFLLSLAGLPPVAGFVGKVLIFETALAGGFIYLVMAGIAGTLLSLYYYLRVVVYMFMREPDRPSIIRFSPVLVLVMVISTCAVLVLAFQPGGLLELGAYSMRLFS